MGSIPVIVKMKYEAAYDDSGIIHDQQLCLPFCKKEKDLVFQNVNVYNFRTKVIPFDKLQWDDFQLIANQQSLTGPQESRMSSSVRDFMHLGTSLSPFNIFIKCFSASFPVALAY